MNRVAQPLTGPEVWTGSSLAGRTDWIWRLDRAETDELAATVAACKARGLAPAAFGPEDFPIPRMAARLERVREELEGGRGFALLRGLPIADYSDDDARILFWGLSVHLGDPQEQDGAGNRMHSVTNTGLKVSNDNSVRSYQTDDELTFHNDGGDAFMLLCLRTARSGGVSKLVSVAALYNEVLRRRPDLVDVLQQPYHFDTRGQHRGGLRIQSVPILNFFEGKLSALYKRRYLRLAQELPDVPRWTQAEAQAIELVEEICNDPQVQLSFSMEPGDIQIGNNYSVLHARTKYQDHDDPAQRRHLLRAWVTLPNGRPLPEVFRQTREFGTSYERRHGRAAATV
ncbi:Taurine catabolism dioxygenase TauD, TfdA family [Pigmentiphaga humi]|uniref:Taurine catabolism dioxygenase TauD, TfdA family n=1 Tax=Pigmentiphaga humi TaxID=2478468 RepID=A0A3P4B298_9BURK|nr:TauD/TfdA family dioxygenase [Pigmentiphaga humi]VCU70409.1 Taurine catabolism dioxygenase TauD, TfdA family [Pigmentiphaga humi]